jgi:hypothetical protein
VARWCPPAAVEGINLLVSRLVDDGVRAGVSVDFCKRRQRLQIHHTDFGLRTVAAEAFAELGRDGEPVHTRGVGDVADHGVGIEIHDNDVGAVRDIQPACLRIDRQIVPAGVACDRDLFDEMVCGRRVFRRGDRGRAGQQGAEKPRVGVSVRAYELG